MRVVLFYHSLLSDYHNSLAHCLRGLSMELLLRGHEVVVYEPRSAWSLRRLLAEHGHGPVARFHAAYPGLASRRYDFQTLDLEAALDGADLAIVHEWTDPTLVRALGLHHALRENYRLFFHASHLLSHAALAPAYSARVDPRHYDGVLAASQAVRDQYQAQGWAGRAWTWHDAADTRLFRPVPGMPSEGDLVWVGNWHAGERAAALDEFLIQPVRALGLRARVYGAGYTPEALAGLAAAGIEYGGWVPNYELPQVFARFKLTVHLPPLAPGAHASRPFQALACGLPLVSAGREGSDGLFQPGADYALARDGAEMTGWLRTLLENPDEARRMARHGQHTVQSRHTCAHRVDELLGLLQLPLPQLAREPYFAERFANLPLAV